MTTLRAPLRASRWWFVPAGIALFIAGNHYLNRQQLPLVAVLALLAGTLLVIVDVWRSGWLTYRPAAVAADEPTPRRRQLIFLGIAAVAAVITWVWSGDNTFRATGVVAWFVAIAAWLVAWWPGQLRLRRGITISLPKTVSTRAVLTFAFVVGALAVGVFFRFYQIESIPLSPTSDHSEKLQDVTDVLDGMRPIFFERNTGREPLQFYFTAGLIRLFDLPTTFASLKLGTAFVGTVAILFIYLLTAEFAGRFAGLSAAFLVAVSAWGTEISRAGLRFPYAMVASAAVLWMLLRWMRTKHRRDALICGLFIGIGLNGYTPFRVVVPAVCLGILIALIVAENRALRVRLFGDGILIGATAAVAFLPLGRFALERPDLFWHRSTSLVTNDGSAGSDGLLQQLPIFLRNNWHAAIGPNWRGDSTMVNAVSFAPMMDLISGALLLAGLVAIGTHIAVGRDPRAIFLVLAIPILVLPSTLSTLVPWENPSVNREAPVVPIVFLIAALPIALMHQRLIERFGDATGAVIGAYAAAGLIAVAATQSYVEYFHDFDRQTRAIVSNTSEIADAIRGGAIAGVAIEDTYVIDSPNWMDIRNVGFAIEDIDWAYSHNVVREDPLPTQPAGRSMMLIVNASDVERLDEIERRYPTALVSTYPSEIPDKTFVTIIIPAD